jgi:hypothetical protein
MITGVEFLRFSAEHPNAWEPEVATISDVIKRNE